MESISINSSPTTYPELSEGLCCVVKRIQENNFIGAYLQGSFAVGDFDIHSDVDFLVVIKEELTAHQVDAL